MPNTMGMLVGKESVDIGAPSSIHRPHLTCCSYNSSSSSAWSSLSKLSKAALTCCASLGDKSRARVIWTIAG